MPKTGKIGLDAVPLLRPTVSNPKTGDYFVKNQENPFTATQVLNIREETLRREDNSHVSHDRLYDQTGDVLVTFHDSRHGIDVVELGDVSVFCQIGWYPSAVRNSIGFEPRARLHKQAVNVAMIASPELDDPILGLRTTSQPDSAHRGFSAGADKPHQIHRRHGLDQHPRKVDFMRMAGSEARSILQGTFDFGYKVIICMTKYDRSPGRDVVKVGIVIHIKKIGTLPLLDVERCTVHGAEGPHRAVDAAG